MFFFSIYVVVLQIILQIINILKPSDTQSSDIIYYVILSIGTLLIAIVYFVIFNFIRLNKIQSDIFKIIAVNSFLYIYVCIQLVFCTLNIRATGGVESYYIAILLVGLVPVLSHRQSIFTILGAFVYIVCILVFVPSMQTAWDSILLTDVWANMIILTGLTACIAVFTTNLYISNFIQGVELTEYNQELLDSTELLEKMANTDHLTGLPNRHDLSSKMDFLWYVSIRTSNRLAIGMFDIDYFKHYNDTFGHPEGDECLKKIATALFGSFRRKNDIVCRYGGEEFLVVIEAGDNPEALFEAARKNIEALKIPHAKKVVSPFVTVSCGVCLITPTLQCTTEEAVKLADDALYQSKKDGRNRITVVAFENNPSDGQSDTPPAASEQ
jgi:diguanylate cyclase (GGDEF)-like protein